eukprot:g12072.t1
MQSSGDGGAAGDGGGWRLGSVGEANYNVVAFLSDLLARHGWTAIFIFVVWYNCKDAVKRRYRRWKNERSIAHANRPARRGVLDRERARVVAEKQEEARQAARELAERKAQQKIKSYDEKTAATKDD